MWQHVGASRYIWNYMLELQIAVKNKKEKHLSGYDMGKLIKNLKNQEEHFWMKQVSRKTLERTCYDLSDSYENFFAKRTKFPCFKSKKKDKAKFPIRTDRNGFYFVNEKYVQVEKIGKIHYKTDFNLFIGKKHNFINGRIENKNGKWMLGIAEKCENQTRVLTDYNMGIDLGIKELAVVEFNGQCKVYHNINKSKKMKKLNKKLKYYQRKVSRQYRTNPKNKSGSKAKGIKWEKSKNIVKTENKIRRIYAKIANIRQNYIHQTTHKLIEMLPKQVVMEDLNTSGLMKNRHLLRVIGEMCWYEFIRQMKYKCEWNGIEFIQADRFYPSSKTCSCCGNVKKDLKLKDRIYICDICGLTIDRDYNAAINLSKYLGI